MLKRIRIKNFKSFEDVEVRPESLAVLFGPNASGKSNFLDALQLLSRLAANPSLNDAFSPPYRGTALQSVSFGREGLRGLRKKDKVSFSLEIDVQLSSFVVELVNSRIDSSGGKELAGQNQEIEEHVGQARPVHLEEDEELRYFIEIQVIPERGFVSVSDESLIGLPQKGGRTEQSITYLQREQDRLLLQIEGLNKSVPFDRYLGSTILSGGPSLYFVPHLYALQQELINWHFFYFEPRMVMRLAGEVKEVHHMGVLGDGLGGLLNTLKHRNPEQFEALEAALHLIIPSVTGIDVGVNDAGAVDLRLLEEGTPVPAQLLSDGTLRILGLLALSAYKYPPALVAIEEPENGIHPRRIQLIAELLKNRSIGGDTQMIVTTHSPILPNIIPRESLLICRKDLDGSTIEPVSAWEPTKLTSEMKNWLAEEGELSISERILRGDFDAA